MLLEKVLLDETNNELAVIVLNEALSITFILELTVKLFIIELFETYNIFNTLILFPFPFKQFNVDVTLKLLILAVDVTFKTFIFAVFATVKF
jgi:hypothetical protein